MTRSRVKERDPLQEGGIVSITYKSGIYKARIVGGQAQKRPRLSSDDDDSLINSVKDQLVSPPASPERPISPPASPKHPAQPPSSPVCPVLPPASLVHQDPSRFSPEHSFSPHASPKRPAQPLSLPVHLVLPAASPECQVLPRSSLECPILCIHQRSVFRE
ncbi:merozoite surface protein CMZ-8-like [Acanthaster planci]|uniref:Merozoite surface protein CMZ-8-like n=1 Tax=Acanthaster planci TaxID=133434 RepID=A0A8B7ZNW5_ACAPL|nr:merozoite surface protein CMZ-8-like [Acanthaster planci]